MYKLMSNIHYVGSSKRIVWAVEGSKKMRGKEFFETLTVQDRAKAQALFERMGDHGEIRNTEKFRHEEEGIYCFKSFQVRFPCFFDGSDVVVTHGLRKKADKMPRTELDRAKRIRKEHRGRQP
jgi:phage-related protein